MNHKAALHLNFRTMFRIIIIEKITNWQNDFSNAICCFRIILMR